MKLMRLLAIYGLVFSGLCQWERDAQSNACTVQTNGDLHSDPSLDDIIERALRYKEDDKVTLQFPRAATTAPPSAVTSRVMRPRLGQNVSFSCQVPFGAQSTGISWTHQGRTVFEQGQPGTVPPVSNHRYNILPLDDSIAVLRILNVSLQSSGEVVCFLPEATGKIALNRFTLIPYVTRATEVFAAPLASHYRVTVGDRYMISCPVRLPLAPDVMDNLLHHYMLRHNGQLINMPREEPYTSYLPASWKGTLSSGSGGIAVDRVFGFNLISSSARLDESGPVQCWVRPHKDLHEWIVQSTWLVVKEKP
ncbi:uncharacterized protein LOC129600498 [Paramacrobiotus metropolitanus]|uniref:uncharacterized protein LOC129600498 n=1 Tax=Paramacrobiotus metropolitanus TaxID=2943436 RepID=UPI00244629E2|nr:uncharacterized protein LOC129600498 [Paramacrobiotus metropolitanus]